MEWIENNSVVLCRNNIDIIMMEPVIKVLPETYLVGLRLPMSLMNNRTGELWKKFMPRKQEIKNAINSDLFSMQVYPTDYFKAFNPATPFEKWAALAVPAVDNIPPGMEVYTIRGGHYAVFHYKGSSAKGSEVFQYIFNTWLPTSTYSLDNREHFEILGTAYKNNDPTSEEDIWIPIK